MLTKPTNTNPCEHAWEADPWEPGMQTCGYDCGATREAPVGADDDVHVVSVAVEYQRSAA